MARYPAPADRATRAPPIGAAQGRFSPASGALGGLRRASGRAGAPARTPRRTHGSALGATRDPRRTGARVAEGLPRPRVAQWMTLSSPLSGEPGRKRHGQNPRSGISMTPSSYPLSGVRSDA